MVGPDKFGSIPSPLLCFIANFLGGVAKPFFNSGSVSMPSHCNAKIVQFLVCYFYMYLKEVWRCGQALLQFTVRSQVGHKATGAHWGLGPARVLHIESGSTF